MPTGQMPSARFDGGRFLDIEVPLGELRTDDAGRLLVFGGTGHSGPAIPGTIAVTFANNDLWYDDTSDGPVDATVRIAGREIPVTGAWVVVAPPNYAPGHPVGRHHVRRHVRGGDLSWSRSCGRRARRSPA